MTPIAQPPSPDRVKLPGHHPGDCTPVRWSRPGRNRFLPTSVAAVVAALVVVLSGCGGTESGDSGSSSSGVSVSAGSPAPSRPAPAPGLVIPLAAPGEPGLVVGHRGNSAEAPENTVESEQSAVEAGADVLEFDLHLSADGVPVVLHDDTVDRTTDGTGPVSELTAEQISGLDAGSWFSPEFAGTAIPTLDELLAYAATTDALVLPELKTDWSEDEIAMVVESIRSHGLADRTMFQSFSIGPLQIAAQLAPEIARGGLISSAVADPVALVGEFDGQALLPKSDLVTPELVQTMHAAGLVVMTWSVDSPEEWERLTDAGVDGIMTNAPGDLVEWIDQR